MNLPQRVESVERMILDEHDRQRTPPPIIVVEHEVVDEVVDADEHVVDTGTAFVVAMKF